MPISLERSAQIVSSSAKRFWTWTELLSHRVSYNSHRKIFQTVKGPKYRSHNRSPKKKTNSLNKSQFICGAALKTNSATCFCVALRCRTSRSPGKLARGTFPRYTASKGKGFKRSKLWSV